MVLIYKKEITETLVAYKNGADLNKSVDKILHLFDKDSSNLEKLRQKVMKPQTPSDEHLKFLWDNGKYESIFLITGVDVTHLINHKEEKAGLKINKIWA